MERLYSWLVILLLALPTAVGPSWQCKFAMPDARSCCCHGDEDEAAPSGATLDRNCCCAMKRSVPDHSTPSVGEVPVTAAHAPDLGPVVVEDGLSAVAQELAPVHHGWNTGPPNHTELLRPVRLRP